MKLPIASLCLLSPLAVQAANPKVEVEYALFPQTTFVSSERRMDVCLINHGDSGELIHDGFQELDRALVSIPVGVLDDDLTSDPSRITCAPVKPGWACEGPVHQGDQAILTLRPQGRVPFAAGETVCVELAMVDVNAQVGLVFFSVDQQFDKKRAKKPVNTRIELFKADLPPLLHDDLGGIRPDQHHPRYTDEEAWQAVLDRDGQGSTLDADTLDGQDSQSLEESAEIDADIAQHAAIPDAHHRKTDSFSELLDQASDAQIPDDITIQRAGIASALDCTGCVSSVQVTDASLLDADLSPAAAIDGRKVRPDFGAANLLTDGRVGIGVDIPSESLHALGSLRLDRPGTGSMDLWLGHDTKGGVVQVRDGSESTVVLDAASLDTLHLSELGGTIRLGNGAGRETLLLSGGGTALFPLGFTFGAEITLRNADGAKTIEIDGDDNGLGVITTHVLEVKGGADLAERFEVSGATVPGLVVAIDPARPGWLRVATEPYGHGVAGVLSGANGVRPGLTLRQEGSVADGSAPVALSGRVWTWCDAGAGGPIRPGDLLTSSSTPGHAMKADPRRAPGSVLGKAMTGLETGRGLVLVLVSLQ